MSVFHVCSVIDNFNVKSKCPFSFKIKIERVVGNGSIWNETVCAGLRWKLDVFLYKNILQNSRGVLCLIALDVSADNSEMNPAVVTKSNMAVRFA